MLNIYRDILELFLIKMIPAVRLATHEIDELVEQQYREAKLKRLNQVGFSIST